MNPTVQHVLMSFARRSSAAVSGLFLLQLMLLGSGTLCATHHGLARSGAPGHTMVGMAHEMSSDQSAVLNAGESGTPMSPVDRDGGGDHDGCRLPFAPGQCSSMTACDVRATPAATIGTAAYVHLAALALPAPALEHSGPTFAPELPPPRV